MNVIVCRDNHGVKRSLSEGIPVFIDFGVILTANIQLIYVCIYMWHGIMSVYLCVCKWGIILIWNNISRNIYSGSAVSALRQVRMKIITTMINVSLCNRQSSVNDWLISINNEARLMKKHSFHKTFTQMCLSNAESTLK